MFLQNRNQPIWTDFRGCFHDTEDILPIHGRVMHPQTQGKIERYHLTMKNVVKLNNYYLPEQLVDSIGEFVAYYNHERYHESLKKSLLQICIMVDKNKYSNKEKSLKKRP